MINSVNEPVVKKNYDFIDHIRCLSMVAIVAEHTISYYPPALTSLNYWPYLYLMEFFKYGTIIFFLLSGFLISEKFRDYSPGEYLKRRFRSTFGPWLFWSLLFALCLTIHLKVTAGIYHDNRFNLANILDGIKMVYLYSNYWFIINFMVSITLLLIFKRHLYSLVFGTILFLFTIFYCINIYPEWINPNHTTAILGFIFFLWLGAQCRKYWPQVNAFMERVPFLLLILLTVATFAACVYETHVLTALNSSDPLNTLRFTNVLYSLVIFALLLKINSFKVLDHLKPRSTTYGIYLIHSIIVFFVLPEVLRPLSIDVNKVNLAGYVGYKFIYFLLAYFITLLLVFLINKTRGRRLVGN